MISTIVECVNANRAGALCADDDIFQLLRINYALFVSLTRFGLSNSRHGQLALRYHLAFSLHSERQRPYLTQIGNDKFSCAERTFGDSNEIREIESLNRAITRGNITREDITREDKCTMRERSKFH